MTESPTAKVPGNAPDGGLHGGHWTADFRPRITVVIFHEARRFSSNVSVLCWCPALYVEYTSAPPLLHVCTAWPALRGQNGTPSRFWMQPETTLFRSRRFRCA